MRLESGLSEGKGRREIEANGSYHVPSELWSGGRRGPEGAPALGSQSACQRRGWGPGPHRPLGIEASPLCSAAPPEGAQPASRLPLRPTLQTWPSGTPSPTPLRGSMAAARGPWGITAQPAWSSSTTGWPRRPTSGSGGCWTACLRTPASSSSTRSP